MMEYYNGMLTLWQELDLCYDDQWECTSDSARHMKREENDRVYVFLLDLTKNWTRLGDELLGGNPCQIFTKCSLKLGEKKLDRE